jgi:hypothetical protein
MRATYKICGQPWSVSIRKNLNKPYVCPKCSKIQKIALIVIGFIISCLLVPKLNSIANYQRGYRALGGEIFVPVLYLVIIAFIKEVSNQKKENAHQ